MNDTILQTPRGFCIHCGNSKRVHSMDRLNRCPDLRNTYQGPATTTSAAPKYRPTPCRHCGFDLKGMYGSDRQAHKDGWCGN